MMFSSWKKTQNIAKPVLDYVAMETEGLLQVSRENFMGDTISW